MIATWMLYGTVIAVLAGLGALALERGARLFGKAGRWCWVGAMLVTLALPVAAWLRPIIPTRLPSTPVPSGVPVALTPAIAPAAPVIPTHVATPRGWSDFDRPLIYGWALLSLGLFAWFVVGWVRLARMRTSWRSADGVLVSRDVGPAVIGFLRCQVVIPEWSLQLASEQRELLLAHEAEHLLAHDARLLMVSAALLALVPWNPGLWWQFRRLRLAIELDCDHRVLRRRPDPATYGRLLLDVGARAARNLVPVAAFHEPMSSLEHRIRALTALRPRRPVLWAVGAGVVSGMAIFAACEAPRPMGPARKQAFVIQTKEEQGQISSTFIADSVRYYFPQGVQGSVYVWFVVSPDHHVLRYGTTPWRKPETAQGLRVAGRENVTVIRSEAADSVIPDFDATKTLSVTIVGASAMGAGSQPVYWAVLRDPNKPATWLPPEVDSLALLPWMREGLQKYWAPLLREKSGPPADVWFVSDAQHDIIATHASNPMGYGAHGYDLSSVGRHYQGLKPDMIQSLSLTSAHGWARSNVQIVWVTLRDNPASRRWIESWATYRDTFPIPLQWLWQSEGNEQALNPPSRAAMLEKGTVVVAEKYPQYLNRPADPPVTIWVVEGQRGQILSSHVSKAYSQLGSAEMAAELPGYQQFRPGEWMSWLPLSDQRTDVRIVWMHSNRGT